MASWHQRLNGVNVTAKRGGNHGLWENATQLKWHDMSAINGIPNLNRRQ